ncbi:MAG: V-type ATPase 116kDa subunit family protein [Eubacteriales bacterium]|nr:V-type ATPase 116kDa subunit family protein [Eubacteriales bacterium]
MIEKLKYLNITGPKADIDRMVSTYLSRYEIHLENAVTELTDVSTLSPYLEPDPYKEALAAAKAFCAEIGDQVKRIPQKISAEEALSLISKFQKEDEEIRSRQQELSERHAKLIEPLKLIRPFRNFDYDLAEIQNFQHIRYQFGRIDKQSYKTFEQYLYKNINTVFLQSEEDDRYIYGIYFAPRRQADKIAAVYSSMHFEPIHLKKIYEGTATEACDDMEAVHKELHKEINEAKEDRENFLQKNAPLMVAAKEALQEASDLFGIRKMAACTPGDQEVFYILCGWMSAEDAAKFQEDIKDDPNVNIICGDEKQGRTQTPPTKLHNPKLFKPFELYIKMYGLPAYGEMDPTWFLAITYSFIFGAMFGDVGQGLLLAIGGGLLYKFKKMDLAGIIGCAGIFSTFFGFLYGSVFGFEDILPALWLKPMNKMMTVPFVGTLNAVFVIAIGFGMLLILVCMVLNIINARRAGDVEKTWFDSNAVAGLVFYGSVVLVAFLLVTGRTLPGTALLVILFIVPLILIFLKEPLANLVEKKSKILPDQKAVFFVQSFFELFEVLLSYLSNTLSFLRIGAFAVSHAAMMEVVMMLAGAEQGNPNWIVVILGNLFVCGMEGLIVGIQVLRLEYYEIFSRFYKGSGREFRPFNKIKNN